MKYIIFGGSGFLGKKISEFLLQGGHEVVVVDIRPSKIEGVKFLERNLLNPITPDDELKFPDICINLTGKLIFGRWNEAFKQAIYDTRITATRNISHLYSNPIYKPKKHIQASAVGIYGDHQDRVIDEDSAHGDSFLADLVRDWESEANKIKEKEVEVNIIRNSFILGKEGFLQKVLPFFKLGLGGPFGRGNYYLPWVHIDDCARMYIRASQSDDFYGVVNAVSEEQVLYKDFVKTLAHLLKKPYLFYIPKFTLYLLYGEFAREITLSQRVSSKHFSKNTFTTLSNALDDILNKK